jgi:hypothetical protein
MKKGEMTITTIIAIVLAVVILVFLIYGFSTGWGNFWSRVNIFGGGKANVNDVAQACSMACQSQDTYGFCNMKREVTKEDGSKVSYITNQDEEETEDYEPEYLDINCNTLATNENLGLTNIFEDCPGLC